MAFTYEITATIPVGDLWLVTGVWDSTSETGGDIDTGFAQILSHPMLTHTGSAVEADVAVVNETVTKDAPGPGKFTIVCSSDDEGSFMAICR
jgi:hypothetical protein